MALTLAFSESSLNYNAIHQGRYKGICGVVPDIWKDKLDEENVELNSLKACIVVYKHYLDKSQSKRKALKEYKGIQSQEKMWIVDKVLKITNELKHKYQWNAHILKKDEENNATNTN